MYTLDELKKMVFIDIETTTQTETFQELVDQNPRLEDYWKEKTAYLKEQNRTELAEIEDHHQMWPRMAGLFPEWGKIVCISIGQIKFDETGMPTSFSAKSFYGDDEAQIMKDFMKTAGAIMQKYPDMKWVGHNVKGFDLPYIIKRALVHRVPVIRSFHLHKQKPWEGCLIDTQDVWKFGNWTGSARLGLIAEVLDIPTPKDDMAGYQVNQSYWEGGNNERIKDYCEKDIEATANLMLRFAGMPLVNDVPF